MSNLTRILVGAIFGLALLFLALYMLGGISPIQMFEGITRTVSSMLAVG